MAHLNLRSLPFQQQEGRHAEKVIYLAELHERGGYVAGQEAVVDLALHDDTLAKLNESGISFSGLLTAPAGKYRLRVAMEEAGGKRMAETQTVEIR